MLYATASKIFSALVNCVAILTNCLAILKRVDSNLTALATHQLALEKKLDFQQQQLAQILAAVTPQPAVGFHFIFQLAGQIFEGAAPPMKNSQKLIATITPVDAKGQPTTVDGAPTWAVDDPTKATLKPSADGLSCEVDASGPIGDVKLVATGDADLGEGVKPIFGEATITITPGDAVGFKLSLSEPTEQ